MRFLVRIGSFAVFLAAPAISRADPPPPKVCVIVAGDPDDVARGAARAMDHELSLRTDVRVLADDAVRAALRGDVSQDPAVADVVSLRRTLHGDDTDGLTLDALGHRLGCTLTVEFASRPEGVWLRSYDVMHHTFIAAGASRVSVGSDLVPVFAATARRAVDGTLQVAWGLAAGARLVISPLAVSSARAANTAASSPAPVAPSTSRGPGIIGWAVAGGAALLLVGGFLLAQSAAPASSTITVTHAGAGNSP